MSGHWYLGRQGDTLVRSTTYIHNNQVLKVNGHVAYALALKNVETYVKQRKYKGIPMWLTYSPSHYQGGPIPTCPQQTPISLSSGLSAYQDYPTSMDFRRSEVTALHSTRFRLIDITMLSQYRPDGHVQTFYGGVQNSKTTWDCTHWCLPGVPDVWTDVLQHVLRTQLHKHK
eukprot:TRINITY_DN8901_c0_g1_i2.p1 TRINITY_DN8901_c0_g1~~TRINITY_DN8901_c0_g1_i2.p1  ORF type:complete len:179 (-),score=28.61 TRINITY_DN8901_c0_g1_i2:93-608(-)